MGEGNTAVSIIGGALIGVLLTSVLIIYAFPAMNVNQKGIVHQSIFREFSSDATILDSQTTEIDMPETNVTISTKGNSKIIAEFNAYAILYVNTGFLLATRYNITLSISGVGEESILVVYWVNAATTNEQELPIDLSIHYETGALPAGAYTIKVSWFSDYDANVQTRLWINYAGLDNPRSLSIMEIGC